MKSPALGLLLLLALIRVPPGGVRASEARAGGAAIAEISEELPSFEIVAEAGEAAPRRLRKGHGNGRTKCRQVNVNNTKLVNWCFKQCVGCKCTGCSARKKKKAQNSRWCRTLDCNSITTPKDNSITVPRDTDNVELRNHSLGMCSLDLAMSKKKERWCNGRCDFCRGTSKCNICVDGLRKNEDLRRCKALDCPPRGGASSGGGSSSSSNLNSRMGVWRANPIDGGDGDDPDDDDDTSELDAEFLAMMAEYDPYIGLAGEARGSL